MLGSARSHYRGAMAAGLVALAGLVPGVIPGSAEAQSGCGEFYRIQRGDTLQSITQKELGHGRFRDVYQANRDILPSASRIETGQLLFLPCDGRGPRSRSAALSAAGVTPTARDNLGDRFSDSPDSALAALSTPVAALASEPTRPPLPEVSGKLLLLTGSGFAPLSDVRLPGGGLASLLAVRALEATGAPVTPRLIFVDDRKAHLADLMPTGAFALGFPWPRPDCARPAGPESEALCRTLVFSRPIFELSMVLLAHRDSDPARAETLEGRLVCRPASFPPVDLEGAAARPVIVTAETPEACIALLRDRAVEFVSLPESWALPHESDPDFADRTAQLPATLQTVPVHAVAWKSAPGAEDAIAVLDAGLAELQSSGAWFRLVSDYLADYNARLARGLMQ